MFKYEIREDSVLITGYVNAVERYSKPLFDWIKGIFTKFVERIKAGVFKKALERNKDVKVLLNHDHSRELARTSDGTAKLYEDSIGLRAEVTVTDKEVVEKARNGELIGWSFGFYCNDEEYTVENGLDARTITDLDLIEVSILDNTTSPAYYGTLIEARSEDNKKFEIRNDLKVREDIYIDELAELIAVKIVERLKKQEEVDEQSSDDDGVEDEIDYSYYENKLKNL